MALGLLAKPAAKWVLLGIAVLGLIAITFATVRGIYTKGERAGKAEVTTKVQEETIKTIDAARRNRERAEDAVRATPIEGVIDSFK
jgi:hypothetical protein